MSFRKSDWHVLGKYGMSSLGRMDAIPKQKGVGHLTDIGGTVWVYTRDLSINKFNYAIQCVIMSQDSDLLLIQ